MNDSLVSRRLKDILGLPCSKTNEVWEERERGFLSMILQKKDYIFIDQVYVYLCKSLIFFFTVFIMAIAVAGLEYLCHMFIFRSRNSFT